MTSIDIFTLRPEGTSAAAIRTALDKATAATSQQHAVIKAARQERDELLLDGSPAALKTAEATLAAAAELAERVATIRAQLEKRLAIAVEGEAIEKVRAAAASATAANVALNTWWKGARKVLQAKLAEGLALKKTADLAMTDWEFRKLDLAQVYPEAEANAQPISASASCDWPDRVISTLTHNDFCFLNS